MKHPLSTHQRQVHLDFHTSPHIPGVASAFDATSFARTFREAHVNSVTIFAKCHHGYTYFPSKVGVPHPQLDAAHPDLLGEQIEALHREGIRCPIYITVGWEELSAEEHPDWCAMMEDGTPALMDSGQPGPWRFLNWLHPEYQQHMEELTVEVMDRYGAEVDGFFYDICFFPKGACWSPESRRFREQHGLTQTTPDQHDRFLAKAQETFAARYAKVIHSRLPQATLFFNAGSDTFLEPGLGGRARFASMTHMEIESLPSGFWGYFHFPRLARSTSHWGKPWLGMTGRFQTAWGDFGGIKPLPALEFECFRPQAMGGANSIGDQLPPRGILDPAAYDLVGKVYAQVEEAEPFYEGSTAMYEVGITTSGTPGVDGNETAKSDEGAIQMCEEAHYECQLLDAGNPLDELSLVILGDGTTLTPEFVEKLKAYYEAGGRLLISHKGGCDASGNWAFNFLPIRIRGEVEAYPTYWRTSPDFSADLSRTDRVIYSQGLVVETSATVLVERVLPYFKRDAARFCSHLQTPPRPEASGQPAVVAGERFVYFADPIFREYREWGNIAVRDAWQLAMGHLIGAPRFGEGMASTIQVYPRRRNEDLLITLLHYIPVRKALRIDMIEERSSFAGEILRFSDAVTEVREYPSGKPLSPVGPGAFALPTHSAGRLLLEVPGYFRKPATS